MIDKKPKEKPHYVNNAQFSQAVVEHVSNTIKKKENNEPKPIVPDYIARCFLKIAEGLSHKANFVRYTYREELVMDAVENCLKAIENYNIETATRTGKPNAFAYFTQISWYAFLRRIQKEKRQQDVKLKYMSESGIENLIMQEVQNSNASAAAQAFVDSLRERIDVIKDKDQVIKEYSKSTPKKKRIKNADSDLSDFIVYE